MRNTTVVTDQEAAFGSWKLAEDERIIVELAYDVGVALCYNRKLKRAHSQRMTNDNNVTIDLIAR